MDLCFKANASEVSMRIKLPRFVSAAYDAVAHSLRVLEEQSRPEVDRTWDAFYGSLGAAPAHDLSPGRALDAREDADREALRQLLLEEAGHFLTDIEWRYKQARDLVSEVSGRPELEVIPGGRQYTAEDLNTTRHMLTGYTVTNNSPGAGSIAWAALHVVYNGVDYTITDGNSALKYHWFVKPASGTTATMTSSNTKPILGVDDILLFINNGGVATVAASEGSASLPTTVADNAVDNLALQDSAVSGNKVASAGIGSGKLGTGAVNLATQFAAGVVDTTAIGGSAVTSAKLGPNAVIAGKLADGAVDTPARLATNVVTTGAIADNNITSTKIGPNAVVAGKLADGAIDTAARLAANVVAGGAIQTGAVSTTKLNVLRHFLY